MRLLASPFVVMLAGCATVNDPPCERDYPAQQLRELEIIAEGELIDATVDEGARTVEQEAKVADASVLLESRTRVADRSDLAIIDRSRALLASPDVWDRHDDRKCQEAASKVSLFCALKRASIEVTGSYVHRRTALQEVRFALEAATQDRAYEHRLQDFNNDPATSLPDVWAVLSVARLKISQRLAQQDRCAL